jgi:hypothetical protein
MSHAQFTLPNTENSVFISLLPEHPTPGSAVHLRARSSIIDLQNSAITWYVNNKVVASGTGLVEATVVAGTLGSNTAISVSAETETASASGKAVITPTIVDLLWESDSYTPPFYAGRSLPSAGSKLHLQALAWFRRSNGSAVSPADIRQGTFIGCY